MDVLDKFDVGEEDLAGMDGLDQRIEEARQRFFESGSALALCDNGILRDILLRSG